MDLNTFFSDKSIKPKDKTLLLVNMLKEKKIGLAEMLDLAEKAKDPIKATCIEALEHVTKEDPGYADTRCFRFAIEQLAAKAPRVKWESARLIGNTAAHHTALLEKAIVGLLNNSEHDGTVVRWSAAYALGEILKLKTKYNKDLLPAIESIIEREEKNSIRKIYADAIKKSSK